MKSFKLLFIVSLYITLFLLSPLNSCYSNMIEINGEIITKVSSKSTVKLFFVDKSDFTINQTTLSKKGTFNIKLDEGNYHLVVTSNEINYCQDVNISNKKQKIKIDIRKKHWATLFNENQYVKNFVSTILAAFVGLLVASYKIRSEKIKNLKIYKDDIMKPLEEKVKNFNTFIVDTYGNYNAINYDEDDKTVLKKKLIGYIDDINNFLNVYQEAFQNIFATFLPKHLNNILRLRLSLKLIESYKKMNWFEDDLAKKVIFKNIKECKKLINQYKKLRY